MQRTIVHVGLRFSGVLNYVSVTLSMFILLYFLVAHSDTKETVNASPGFCVLTPYRNSQDSEFFFVRGGLHKVR